MESVLTDPFALAGSLLEGQYRVDAVVGEGGFGVVYRGRHLSLDQPIAIKVLKGLDGGDPSINALVLEKFRAEARLLYTLSQSSLHIVRALDFGASSMPTGAWAPFMILEWLDGRSLAEDLLERHRLGRGGRSVDDALVLLEPVAEGLATAHHGQVAHRDVKPANIFLLRDADPGRPGPRVKVLDFGIAKIMKEGEAAGTKGTFSSFTWLYAAPEQLDPRVGPTGLATDVYGFGLLLTELLSGRRPVDGRDVLGILKTATDPRRRPTPRTLGANVPDALEAVCLRALAVNPLDRYPNITELWAALAAVRAAERGSTTVVPSLGTGGAASASADSAGRGSRTTVLPVSAPIGTSPPHGLPPPGPASPPTSPSYVSGRVTPPPPTPPPFASGRLTPHGMTSPPMTSLPMLPMTAPPTAFGASPPPGTAPPGHRMPSTRLVPVDRSNTVVIVTIVVFVLAVLFAGTCAVVQSACGSAHPADDPGSERTSSPPTSTSRM